MPAWPQFFGPFHSVLVHFPIGFLVLTFLLDIYSLWRSSDELRDATMIASRLTLASAVVVAMFGLWRASTGGYDESTLSVHRGGAFAVIVLMGATVIAQRVAFIRGAGATPALIYRGLFACTLAMVIVTGHYGGMLTHGSRFLVKNAPSTIRAWLEGGSDQDAVGGTLYETAIHSILEARCYDCHGPERHEAGLRFDDPATAQARGRSGRPAIVSGAPMESEMVRRLLLSPEMEGTMPPAGHGRPSAEETMAIIDWIQRGAPFNRPGQ